MTASGRDYALPAFAVMTLGLSGFAFFAGWQWKSENEVIVGALSVPFLTAAFLVALTLDSANLFRVARRSNSLARLFGLPYLFATVCLFAVGLASTLTAGGSTFGLAFYSAFLVWPLLAATAAHRVSLRSARFFVGSMTGLAAVAAVSGLGLRIVPDNINLVGMVFAAVGLWALSSSDALALTMPTKLLAVLCPAVLFLVDQRRTLLLAYVLAVVLSADGMRQVKRIDRLFLWTIGAALGLCLFAVATGGTPKAIAYVTSVVEFASADGREATDSRRAELLSTGWGVIQEAPVTGVGGGRYLESASALAGRTGDLARPHNMVVFLWAELGLAGLVASIVVLVGPLWHLKRQTDCWIVLIPATASMLSNDYYFSPGYFLPFLITAATLGPLGDTIASAEDPNRVNSCEERSELSRTGDARPSRGRSEPCRPT